eukprot:5766764-Alexandrium_andersonii.AAC.1
MAPPHLVGPWKCMTRSPTADESSERKGASSPRCRRPSPAQPARAAERGVRTSPAAFPRKPGDAPWLW